MSSIVTNPLIGSLIKSSTVREYAKGQTILYPDDKQPYLYFIKSGAVMMHDIDDNGNRKILYIFGPPTLFPMISFLDSSVQSSWFYTTLVDSELYILSYEDLKDKIQDTDDGSKVYNTILAQMLKEVHELLLHITDHIKTDSTEKVISTLLFLLKHHTRASSRSWHQVAFPMPHQLMAEMTGLTRETVTLTMKELARQKLIRYPSKAVLELNIANLSKYKHS